MSTEADSVVGTIQLTRTTSLVFSVRPWKGRMLAHARKFVSGEKYEGQTKSGLAMGGDVLVSVIDALTRLKAEAPGVKEKQFAKVHKARDTDIIVTVIPPDDLKSEEHTSELQSPMNLACRLLLEKTRNSRCGMETIRRAHVSTPVTHASRIP